MAELKYFTPTLRWIAAVADEPTDPDANPQIKGIYGGCEVTVTIGGVDARAIRLEDLSPEASLLALAAIDARLDDGVLKLNATTELRLVANSPVLDLPDDVSVWYSFRFHHVTYNGKTQDLPTITVAAPFLPESHDDDVDGEVELNLATAPWVSAADAVAGALRVRNVPDDVELVGGAVQFYANGSPIGGPLPIDAAAAYLTNFDDFADRAAGTYTTSTGGDEYITTQTRPAAQLTIAGPPGDRYATNADGAAGGSAGYKAFDNGAGKVTSFMQADVSFPDTGSTSGEGFCLAAAATPLTAPQQVPVHVSVLGDHYSISAFVDGVPLWASSVANPGDQAGAYVTYGGLIGTARRHFEVAIDAEAATVWVRDPFGVVKGWTHPAFANATRYWYYEAIYAAANTDDRVRIHRVSGSAVAPSEPLAAVHPATLLKVAGQAQAASPGELGYAQITASAVMATAAGAGANVAGLSITIPSSPRPVMLEAVLGVVYDSNTASQVFQIVNGAGTVIYEAAVSTIAGALPYNAIPVLRKRLPPGAPGDTYRVRAYSSAGAGGTLNIQSAGAFPAYIAAVAR